MPADPSAVPPPEDEIRMTPALPGEAPDPSATPRLDARLKDVEARRLMSRLPDLRQLTKSEARLAAMLRVAVEALRDAEDLAAEAMSYTPEYFREKWGMDKRLADVVAALARIEALAKGES